MSKRLFIYMLLATGAIVFSIPFVWMATTSVKVDRELFSRELRLLPMAPSAVETSPYIDTQYYGTLEGPYQQRFIADLVRIARETGFVLPDDVDGPESWEQIGRGLHDKMWRSLPADRWTGSYRDLVTASENAIVLEEVRRAAANVIRQLGFGRISIRSQSLQVHEAGLGLQPDARLQNETPQSLQTRETVEEGLSYAALGYDFRNGDTGRLSGTFDLDFDVSDLQRIQLNIRPDDSWHELWLTVEKEGAEYQSVRPLVLANFNWATATWQERGPDDDSNKIKTWTLLRQTGVSDRFINDPRKIKLTFELKKSGFFTAWWHKLSRNYHLVWDHIPFWRYFQTSLFLVGSSILLTLFSCSIVAYAFSRLNWPGRDLCFVILLATMMIPPQVTMIPHFLIWKTLGAYDTLYPLWAGSLFGNAFYIFLLRQFMKGIPTDLEDSARIDGCGFLRIYWQIVLPLLKPSLATISIFTFMASWNDFMGPLIYIADQRLYPLAFGLYAFAVQVANNPALTMAGSLLMIVPVLALFFVAQRYFIQGTTLTGLKG